VPRHLLKISSLVVLFTLLGLTPAAHAGDGVQRLVRRLTAPFKKALNAKVTRREFLGIDAMRHGAKAVRQVVSELRAEQALTPTAITTESPSPPPQKTQHTHHQANTKITGPNLSRRRMLGFLAVGLVAVAMPKPARALELRGTKSFLSRLFGMDNATSKRKPAPTQKNTTQRVTKDRSNVVSPVTQGTMPKGGYFGAPRKNSKGQRYRHRGLDITLAKGQPIRAATSGVVVSRRRLGTYGRVVVILRDDGVKTVYGHLSAYGKIKEGARVQAGDLIGKVGNSGRSTGPHLHFEWRVGATSKNAERPIDGSPVNPKRILKGTPGYPL